MREIKESDWKVFRKLHPIAVERYCQRVLAENEQLVKDTTQTAHERYLAIFRLYFDRNKEMARLFDDFRRSTAWMQLVAIKRHGLITDEEFAEFSQETRDFFAGFEREI